MMSLLQQNVSGNTSARAISVEVNEQPTEIITSLGEPNHFTSKKAIQVSSEITLQSANEEPSHVETYKFTLNEVSSEITSFPVNEKPTEITPQENEERSEIKSPVEQDELFTLNEISSEIRTSHEEVSFDSSSDDVFEGLSELESDADDPDDELEAETIIDPGPNQVDQDLSDITSDQSVKDSPSNAVSREQCVEELRQWVETEAEFYGRTDDDFLVMFLLGCKMDLKKTKTKLTKYYQNRKNIPLWWANKNIGDFDDLLQKRMITLLSDSDPALPTLAIIRYGRIGSEPEAIDRIMALFTTALDINLRRNNCQQNGALYIVDCLDYPLWLITKMLNPYFVYNNVQTLMAAPVRILGLHYINFPLIGRTIWQLCKPFWPKKIRNRFTFSGADWTTLKDKVDVRLLPIEFGGTNGSVIEHEEAFIEEVRHFSDYLIDDNKYGFQ